MAKRSSTPSASHPWRGWRQFGKRTVREVRLRQELELIEEARQGPKLERYEKLFPSVERHNDKIVVMGGGYMARPVRYE